LLRVSDLFPFFIRLKRNDSESCFDVLSSPYSLVIEGVYDEYENNRYYCGFEKKYISLKCLIDDLIDDLLHSNYKLFDSKVSLINNFEFKEYSIEKPVLQEPISIIR